jgi:hypothetical protein
MAAPYTIGIPERPDIDNALPALHIALDDPV